MQLSKLFPNPHNPRTIKSGAFDKLVVSLLTQPSMLSARPIVFDRNMGILGGNMRDRALEHIAGIQAGEFEALVEKIRAKHAKSPKKHPLTVTPELYLMWQKVRETRQIPDKWVFDCTDAWGEAEKEAFIYKDNADGFGEFDYDIAAAHFEAETLEAYGVNIPPDWGEAVELEPEAAPAPKSDTVIRLEYDAETYERVKARLATIAATPEDAVCQILGL